MSRLGEAVARQQALMEQQQQQRQQRPRSMDYPFSILYRPHKTRYGFHHSDRWMGRNSKNDKSDIIISVVDERTTEKVTYKLESSLCSRWHFPLRELMYTFVEQVGVRMEQLEFRYMGDLIPLDATPESLGMEECWPTENVITVSAVTSPYEHRVEMFTRLNRMAKVTIGIGTHQGIVFFSDLLAQVFDYVGLETLVNASQVCRHWFHVSQRYSVLLQLQDGDSSAWEENQQYPLLLHGGCRHSFNLALCDAKVTKHWSKANMRKNPTDNQGFGFCKAAGCVMIRSVSMKSITQQLDSKWQALNSAKTEFMRQIQDAVPNKGLNDDRKLHLQQELPPLGKAGDGFIAEARDWKYKNCAVELYRRYFSPDMYYIFPLIVNKQAAIGLDFQNTNTSLIFGCLPSQAEEGRIISRRRPKLDGDLPSPLGSVSWRIHDAEEITKKGTGVGNVGTNTIHGWKPQIVLEALFIAVWENERGGEYGSSLVAILQSKVIEYAKSRGYVSALLYVEIGFEQPKAKVFWGNNGFKPVVPINELKNAGVSKSDILAGRAIALDCRQLGFIDRRCLRFKDTEQYAKQVIV